MILLIFLVSCSESYTAIPDNIIPSKLAKDFSLIDQNGQEFQFYKTSEGKKVTLLFFGYSHCPDICIFVLEKLTKSLSSLDQQQLSKLLVVYISVDPELDKPDHLQKFMQPYHKQIFSLTGSMTKIEMVLKDYTITAIHNQGYLKSNNDGKIIHTTNLFWINENKEITKSIPHTFSTKILQDELVHSLK